MKCSIFGHREINITKLLTDNLKNIIEDLIVNKGVDTFLFGDHSDFDNLCYLMVTELKIKYSHVTRILCPVKSTAILLESRPEDVYFAKTFKNTIYDDVIESDKVYNAGRASYVVRNYIMIDKSNYCLFYFDKNYKPNRKSGTKVELDYAKRKKKEIILVNI